MDAPNLSTRVTLTINEVCAVSGVGRTTVYAELKAGRLKSVKCGRRTLIPVDALRAWVNNLPQELGPESK